MNTIAVAGFLGRLLVTNGIGYAPADVKLSYGQGASIDRDVPGVRYTFFAENNIDDPDIIDPPTANTIQT